MIAIREKKLVLDGKITINVPSSFGEEVEVIILSEKDFGFWTDEEIQSLGLIGQKQDIDNEDYSAW